MYMDINDEKLPDDLAESLYRLLDWTANEDIILKRMDKFFSPRPARLAETGEELKDLEARLAKLSGQLGGHSVFIFPSVVPRKLSHKFTVPPTENSSATAFDTYGEAAIKEIISFFDRCKHAVCMSHIFFIAFRFAPHNPEICIPPLDSEKTALMRDILENRLWEKMETAYIKLASFWDRTGQLLDFVFFNIRQYEHDGFPKVMDRIRANYIPLFPQLEASQGWQILRSYQHSEKIDGLKWLIRRRNLLVHSLYLRPMDSTQKENPIFISTYNHLEASVRDKLSIGSPEEELQHLHAHLQKAASLFTEVINLCEIGVGIRSDTPLR